MIRTALAALLLQVREHPRHVLLAAAALGLALGPVSPLALLGAAALLACAAGEVRAALLVLGLALAGGLVANARLAALDATALTPLLGRTGVSERVVLLEQPRPGRFSSSALARVATGPATDEKVSLRIGRWARWTQAPSGAVIDVRGRLDPLGSHDGYQRVRGAHAVLRVKSGQTTGQRRRGVVGALDHVRGRAESALERSLPPPQGALLRGMVLGQDERLSAPTRSDFQVSGLAHILAASGQNVVLLAALATPLLALLGLGLRRRLTVVLGLIAVYVPLAGGGAPIQRAAIMGAAGVIAALAGRPASRWYGLGLAMVVTLLVNPRSVADPGWQLSFVAVLAILTLGPRVREGLRRRGMARPVAEAGSMTLAATVGTAPLIALHFGRVSMAAIPANLVAAPAVVVIMWLGMLAAAVGQIWLPAASALNAVNAYPLGFVGEVAHAAAGVPHASIPVTIGSPAILVGVYAVLAALVLRPRLRAPAGALAVLAAAWLTLARAGPPSLPPGVARVSFLDVGQGDATLIQAGGHAMLVDTGPPDGPVVDRLRAAGVKVLDVLVITHAQADHEGGGGAVMAALGVRVLVDGGVGATTAEHRALLAVATHRGVRVVAPDAGQAVRAGPIRFDVLWPRAEPAVLHAGADPNQRAIVAIARAPGLRLFLPADAESDVTAPLSLTPVDVVKVAHHGSADPGLADLLRRLSPQVAVIEVGRHNSYGHPAPQALAALRAVPRVLRTDRDGTVQLTVGGGRMEVHSHA